MSFELLELLIRTEVRVLIVKSDHIPDMNEVRFHMVEKRTSINITRKRPIN